MSPSCPAGNSSVTCVPPCAYNMSSWESSMDQLYFYFYLIILIPGMLGNSLALWVLCRFISKKTKAIIFMINLAVADLAHVMSLPLRVYYYFTHRWPFGHHACMACFYLKYLNMYASVAFLTCISIQRCVFIMHPFCAKKWKRRYDVRISAAVWLVVGLCCSPFLLMRRAQPNANGCFKDLATARLSLRVTLPVIVFGELLGFVLPLAVVAFCSWRVSRSLRRAAGGSPARDSGRALRMVRVCTAVFLFCFAPYHLNFLLYMLVKQELVAQCSVRLAVLQLHPITLCIASLNCCLNPLVYYFLTTEFRQQLSRQGSSILRGRLMSLESTSSF